MEKFVCSVDLKPMKQWIEEEDPKTCRPCLLAPVVQWYSEELEEQGHKDLSDEIAQLASDGTPLQICEKLDTIKDTVEEALRERLSEFDCAAQAYEPE